MKKLIMLFSFLGFLCGCASVNAIKRNYLTVNFADGINAREARAIAQNKLLSIQRAQSCMISFGDVDDRGEYWKVIFSSLCMDLAPIIVNVRKDTGEITDTYEGDIHDATSKDY